MPKTKEKASQPLKIFELRWTSQGEKEWVCARTNIEALKFYLNFTDMGIGELDDADEIIEIPKEKWTEYKVGNSEYDEKDPTDWQEKTFEEFMKDQTAPDIIAGTMYN